jgi:outer membrane protein assembly factor BamA
MRRFPESRVLHCLLGFAVLALALQAPPAAAKGTVTSGKPVVVKPKAAARAPKFNCKTIFAVDDQRLFDFVKTRQAITYARYKGKTIGDITYITLPVFNELDTKENNGLYRLVNRLHVLTRVDPLQKKLLVKEGDAVNDDIIRESERILRGENYLYDAMILPGESCGSTLDLLVVVRDVWTLQPALSFTRSGGDNNTSFGITEDNLFGYGQALSLTFDKTPTRHGISLGYQNKHLFDGHTELGLAHARNSDGHFNQVSLARPFYAFATPWSAGASFSERLQRETVESNNVIDNAYDHREENEEISLGVTLAVRNNIAHRLRVGISNDNDRFSNQDPLYATPLPVDRVLAYPWLEYQALENNYWTTSNLSQLFRNEDINIGVGWTARAGVTSRVLGSTRDMLVANLDWTNVVSIGEHHLFRGKATATMLWDKNSTDFESSVLSYTAAYDQMIDDNNRWHLQGEFSAGLNLTIDEELTAGGEAGLLGYPTFWQRGDRRVVVNMERRHFYEAHVLNLFRLGSALFLEAGKAWDSNGVVVQSDNVLADIGIGLRINSSKARPSHILHLNLAFPLADRRDAGDFQWSVFTANTF